MCPVHMLFASIGTQGQWIDGCINPRAPAAWVSRQELFRATDVNANSAWRSHRDMVPVGVPFNRFTPERVTLLQLSSQESHLVKQIE